MKTRFLLTAILSILIFTADAQTPSDSIKATALDEIVVEGVTREAITDGVSYIPSKNVRKHSMNVRDMLARMMVAGLKADPFSSKVETISGREVTVFINEEEAEEWEIKAIRPKDVVRVNYLQSPSDPVFKGKQYVVDIILRSSDYGGYAVIDAGQGVILNEGNYSVTGKLTRKKWTLQAYAEAHYSNYDDIKSENDTYYHFSDGTDVMKESSSVQKTKNRDATGALMARYRTPDFYMSLSGGYRHNNTPEDAVKEHLTYTENVKSDKSEAFSAGSSRKSAAYLKTVFEFYNLPHKAAVYAKAGLSYNHSNSSTTYTTDLLADPLMNGARSDAWFPYARIDYSLPVFGNGRLTAAANWSSEIYRTQYTGTDRSFQKLYNSYLYLFLVYSHRLKASWNIGGYVQCPINFHKVNDDEARTDVGIDGNLWLNGHIGRKHSVSVYANLRQVTLPPRYYNDVLRQDNEIEGTKGNSDLKTQKYGSAGFSYTWMPGNRFSLAATLGWEMILDEVVPYWHDNGKLMVKDWINGGDYNVVNLTAAPSLSLAGGNLNIQARFWLSREMHSGHRKFAFYSFNIFPYLSYNLNSHFSVSATYNTPWGKGYMKEGVSSIGKFSDALNLSLTYHTGNLFASCQVQSLLRKDGLYRSYYESPSYSNYQTLSRPVSGRYVWFSLRYTLDFGKKIQKGNDVRFDGTVKSGVL